MNKISKIWCSKIVGLALAASLNAAPTEINFVGEDSSAIADLRETLQDYEAGTIHFEKVALGERTGQTFYLSRKGDKTSIKFTTAQSLENAVYTLLNDWGFHWYGPGEHWFVKPKTIPVGDLPGKWIAPTFRNRNFFGTGGLDAGVGKGYDPENKYKKGWLTWKRRNRYNADFAASGHMGRAYYLENKVLLDAHPDWFNGDTGKSNGRIRIEVPEAVAAFKAWAIQKYTNSEQPFINIGVDPEDGRGGADDPLPPDGFAGISNWNHADKWWWLANETAKEFPADDSHLVVSMYAYGDGPTNVLAPKFKLRKNVYPVIIPNAFQKAYLPAEMVKVWADSIDGKMGIYDYWNITQWSLGLPQFNLLGLEEKLQFWHAHKIDGIYNETTDAAGPMGHVHWLAGQLQFDLGQDFDQLYSQYLTDLFGKAAPAMKKMYDRWSRNSQGAGEVSLSLADLHDASNLVATHSPEAKRINDLKAYAHFMKLYHEHDGTQESKDRLFHYLYSIHHLYMVQTSAFVGQHYISPVDKGNITPDGTGKRLTFEEIETQFQADLLSNPKRYDVSTFVFDHAKVIYSEAIPENSWRFGRNPNLFIVPQKTETINFEAGSEKNDTELTIFSDDGVILETKVGPHNFDYKETIGDSTWHLKKLQVKVEAGQKYVLRFRGGFNRFKTNSDMVVFNAHHSDDFDNYSYPPHYFYVPKDAEEIIFEDANAVKPDAAIVTGVFFLPGEPPAEPVRGEAVGIKDLYRFKVIPEWKGKVIACSFSHTAWSLKNVPNVLAMQPFRYSD